MIDIGHANLIAAGILGERELACCDKVMIQSHPNIRPIRNALELARYREQGTVEEFAVAAAHLEACTYATESLPD